jgi:prepilin-type N-terminal cleavage/methylation domain-containing protein
MSRREVKVMTTSISESRSTKRFERGFSLLEVMFSMTIMTVGLVALLGVMSIAMASTQTSEQLAISKRLANEALESILTARETDQVQWSNIANGNCAVGAGCTTGIFLPGPQAINLPGVDGIIGTSDDAAAGPQILDMPGSTGVVLTPSGAPCAAPDNCLPLTTYTRTIAIAPFGGAANLNSVTITVTYINPQLKVPQNYTLSTLISQYR